MQDPVAEFLGFGSRKFAVQQEVAGPGEEGDRREAEFEPGGVDAKISRGEAAEAGGFAAPDVILHGGVSSVTDLQELGPAKGKWGIGEEDLMPHALVLVEVRELGSGVGAFAADDDAGVGRIAVQVGHAGQFGDLGGLAEGAVLVQSGAPDMVGQGSDRAADRLGNGVSDREEGADSACSQVANVSEEGLCGTGAVGADEDVGAVPVGVGICARASFRNAMWSAAVLAPVFPGRRRPDIASPVLARKHSRGWNPKPPL